MEFCPWNFISNEYSLDHTSHLELTECEDMPLYSLPYENKKDCLFLYIEMCLYNQSQLYSSTVMSYPGKCYKIICNQIPSLREHPSNKRSPPHPVIKALT